MEEGVKFETYYKWLHTIIRDDNNPQKALARIISGINPQARLSFLSYLIEEHKQGVVEELIETRFEIGIADDDVYSDKEIEEYTPAERSYLLLCETADRLQALFSDFVPQYIKKLKKLTGNSHGMCAVETEEVCYDETEEYLTTDEAALFLKVKKQTVHSYVSKGVRGVKLPCIKVGKDNRYKKSDLKKLYRRGSYRNEEMEMEVQKEYERMKRTT